eukprot:gene26606-32675_t
MAQEAAIQQGIYNWLQLHSAEAVSAPGYHYDMLHDNERNRVYRMALEDEIEEDDFVLDIGTGSGLLSMLAARTKAQHVFAVEGDSSLAAAAKDNIEANGLSDLVTLHAKFSTDIQVGWSADIPCKADMLVTEIFDSALLGEGMIPTVTDACKRLLTPEAKVIPAGATMTALLVDSSYLLHQEVLSAHALEGACAALHVCSDASDLGPPRAAERSWHCAAQPMQ